MMAALSRSEPKDEVSRAALWTAFWRDRRGVSTVEFALTLPVLLLIFLAMIEFGEVFTVDRRLTIVANSAADLVARTKTVSDSDLSDIANAVDEIVRPYPTATLGLVVSSIETDENNTPSVAWSWASGATARTSGEAFTLPDARLTEPNTSIILAEVSYQFSPSVGLFLTDGTTELEAAAYYRPRLADAVEKK
jgi:Flp pilus assembly protein TadG